MQRSVIAVILLTSLVLAGCSGADGRPAAGTPTKAAQVGAPLSAESTPTSPEGVATRAPSATPRPTGTPTPTATRRPTATPAPTATPKPAELGLSRSNPLPLGSEIRGKTWSIIVTGVVRGGEAAKMVAQANMFNDPPRDGYEYLIANIKLTNISNEEKAQSASFAVDLRLTGDRNTAYSPALVVAPKRLEGDLFPKGTTEGQEVFEVPIGEKNLEFIVQEALSFDAEARRFIAIDEQAKVIPDPALRSVKPTDEGKTRARPAKLGDTLVAGPWEFSLQEVVRGERAAQMVKAANQFNRPAPEGQEYVLVRLKARFLGTADPDEMGSIDGSYLKITGERNVIYESPMAVEPDPSLDADLFAGGETEGWVVLSAAKGEKGLLIIFKPLWSFSDSDTRYIAID